MYGIYGIYHKSLYEICQTLSQLKVNYYIYGEKFNQYKQVKVKEKQSFNVYLVESLSRAKKIYELEPGLMIVLDSISALKKSNVSKLLFPGLKLKQAIKKAIAECKERKKQSKEVELKVEPLRLGEVLKVATSYSFLNGIQTALYKITPYSLRKETQTKIISYFYGDTSYTELMLHLDSSAKLDKLASLCKDKQAKALREACLEARSNPEKIDRIAKASGFASFELMYIIKSHQKVLEDQDDS